jgi:glyceraldehyde-3-phosphate dehydrogenase (NADP+)
MNIEQFFIGNEFRTSDKTIDIVNPYTQETARKVYKSSKYDINTSMDYLADIFLKYRELPAYKKSELLEKISVKISGRKEHFAETITAETGKPIKFSRIEIDRAIFTFKTGAEEAKRIGGEIIPLDLLPGSENKFGLIKRFPIGLIFAITPWNFPVNLVAHKIAPALASGNVVLLKPASASLCCGIEIVKVIHESCIELGLDFCPVNVITNSGDEVEEFLNDNRVKMISFTGSPVVGWGIKKKLDMQKLSLELGGNAGVILDESADIELAVSKITIGAFSHAGQSCISVQRVLVHKNIYKDFEKILLEKTKTIKAGNPFEEDTIVGPMITLKEAERVERWIKEATGGNAEILAGGSRENAVIKPTILANTNSSQNVNSKEVFAPLMTLREFDNFEDAVKEVNNSDYGLQAGVFTNNMKNAMYAFDNIEVGGVVINDISTYRLDSMPYGGVKQSGFGKEGVKYAIEEMTERKLMVIS